MNNSPSQKALTRLFRTARPPSPPAKSRRLGAAVALGLGLLLAAPVTHAQTDTALWTVAVYLNADHNLDESAVADLEEMEKAAGGNLKNVRVVYYLDRNEDEEGASEGVEYGIIKNGEREVVKELDELNSDDPKNLTDFVTWAYKTYPSQKRGLILWDHGGQWDGGFGGDEHGPGIEKGADHKAMSTVDTARAVASSLSALKINKLEFLAFDTCLMGGAELIAQFAPLTQLYIADAEVDFGDGWDYENTLGYLDANPGVSMREFGKVEVGHWEKHHLASGKDDDVLKRTQAAFDTAVWPEVQAALSVFAGDLRTVVGTPEGRTAVLRARSASVDYSFSSEENKPGDRMPYTDLGDFANRVANTTSDAALKASAAALVSAIGKMTVAKSVGSAIPTASGFSIYLPFTKSYFTTLDQEAKEYEGRLSTEQKLLAYAKLDVNADRAWSGLLAGWTSAVRGLAAPVSVEGIKVTAAANGAYRLEFTPSGPNLDAALINLYSVAASGVTTDYGDLYYQKTTGGKKTFDWTPFVWSVTDGKTPSLLTADREDPSATVLSADVQYTPPGEDGFDVILRFNEAGQVTGALDASGLSPIGINLKPGGTLQFYTRTYRANDERPGQTLLAQKLTVPANGVKGLKAVKAPLPANAKYQLAFTVLDLVGNDEGEAVDLPAK